MSRLIRRKLLMSRRSGAGQIACAQFYRPIPRRVNSDRLLVLILAHRYGFIPSGSSYSITELEYRAAREANVPVLAFILDGSIPWPPDHIDWHQKCIKRTSWIGSRILSEAK